MILVIFAFRVVIVAAYRYDCRLQGVKTQKQFFSLKYFVEMSFKF